MSPSRPSLGQSTKSQNGGGSNGDAPTIFECVSRLASRMGLDQPSYNIEPEDLPNLYRGRAQFKLGTRAPDDLGLVKGVLGKNNAKVQVAEKVLVWLQMEMQARQASLQSVMSRANRENQ